MAVSFRSSWQRTWHYEVFKAELQITSTDCCRALQSASNERHFQHRHAPCRRCQPRTPHMLCWRVRRGPTSLPRRAYMSHCPRGRRRRQRAPPCTVSSRRDRRLQSPVDRVLDLSSVRKSRSTEPEGTCARCALYDRAFVYSTSNKSAVSGCSPAQYAFWMIVPPNRAGVGRHMRTACALRSLTQDPQRSAHCGLIVNGDKDRRCQKVDGRECMHAHPGKRHHEQRPRLAPQPGRSDAPYG